MQVKHHSFRVPGFKQNRQNYFSAPTLSVHTNQEGAGCVETNSNICFPWTAATFGALKWGCSACITFWTLGKLLRQISSVGMFAEKLSARASMACHFPDHRGRALWARSQGGR